VSATETMIQTKIARILSPTQVVLAAGLEDGVEEGMEFVIYELSDPIEDPETKESLGQLELHKGRVKVVHVQDRIATARTHSRQVERSLFAPSISAWTRTETVFSNLNVDKSQVKSLPDNALTVKVGDLVRSIG